MLLQQEEFFEQNKPTGPTEAVQRLQEAMAKFKDIWNSKEVMDRDMDNFEQKHDTKLAKQAIKPSVEEEIRVLRKHLLYIYKKTVTINHSNSQ